MAKHEFAQEIVVRVWRDVKKLGILPTGHFGHVSISLAGRQFGRKVYISWWPGEGAGKGDAFRRQAGAAVASHRMDMASEMSSSTREGLEDGTFTPRRGQRQMTVYDEESGLSVETWGQEPDAKVRLPGLGASGVYWGLSMTRMARWWAMSMSWNYYRLASKSNSCAGMAGQALAIGGGRAFASGPSALAYLAPHDIEKWSLGIRGALSTLNLGTAEILIQFRHAVSKGELGGSVSAPSCDLWSLDAWKQHSAVRRATRSSTIRGIDGALAKYHRHHWDGDFQQKLKHLAEITRLLIKHRNEKPDSKRRLASLRLGKQVIDVLKSPALSE